MENLLPVPKPSSSFFQKYRFFAFFASLFLVFISICLLDRLDQGKTKSKILPSPQSTVEEKADEVEEKEDEFEIPSGTSNSKKILLKYNGSEDDFIYVMSLSLDKKWLTFNLRGKDLEIINLNTKVRHQLPYDNGYWEAVIWRPDNISFYATAEDGLTEAGGGADSFFLVTLQGVGTSSFSFEKKSLPWSTDLVGLSPDKEKLALLDLGQQSLQILTLADGNIDSYDIGEINGNTSAFFASWSPDSSKIVYPSFDSIKIFDLSNNKTSVLVPEEKSKTGYSEIISGSSAWSVNGDKLAVYYERQIDTGDPFDGQWDENNSLIIFNSNGGIIQKTRFDSAHMSGTYLLWENDSVYFCPSEVQKLWVSSHGDLIIYKSGFLIIEDQLNNFVKEYCQPYEGL